VSHWQRERCGKGEEVPAVMKNDLAGGQLPSGLFGVNAAWWAIVMLAFNLNALMTHLVLPEGWASKRLKALRFALIGVAGRVLGHARRLIVRLGPRAIRPVRCSSRCAAASLGSRRCRPDSGAQPQCTAPSGAS